MNIGIIGLGNMGSGMASNLLDYCHVEGYKLWVADVNTTVVATFVDRGAHQAESIKALVSKCNVLFTSLPSAKEINQLALGEDGILNNLSAGACWFETSTNELSQWQQLRDIAPDHITLIDAPVTGGSEGAANGTLTMLLGGEAEVIE